MKYYVYILTCSDGSFYTGYTSNIRKRLNQHNGISIWPGTGYTRIRRPVFLQHLERYPSKKDAINREKEIKKIGRKGREELISSTSKEDILLAI